MAKGTHVERRVLALLEDWKWQHGLPRAETVLTSAGVVAANNVLREDGWLDNAIDLT